MPINKRLLGISPEEAEALREISIKRRHGREQAEIEQLSRQVAGIGLKSESDTTATGEPDSSPEASFPMPIQRFSREHKVDI